MTPELLESIKSTFEQTDLSAESFDAFSLFSGLDPDDRVKPLREWALSKKMTADRFDRAHRTWRIRATLGGYPETVVDFARLYADKHHITARFNLLLEKPSDGAVVTPYGVPDFRRDLRLLRDKLGLGYKNDAVADGVDHWLAQAKTERLRQGATAITATPIPDADAEWQRLGTAFVDQDRCSVRYAIAALKTFVWQVKRKIADLEIDDHAMVVLQGPQRAGKSRLIERLTAPVSDLVAHASFKMILDPKATGLWETPIIFCDEMEKGNYSDADAIKNAITKSVHQTREHHRHSLIATVSRSTLIGCMNGTLGEKIQDPTGMRRFAPITTLHGPRAERLAANQPCADWDAINAINVPLLWQSVDPMAAHPLIADAVAKEEWDRLREEERAQESVESWLRQLQPEYDLAARGKGHTGADLYPNYRDFCVESGFKACAVNTLGKKMRGYQGEPWNPFEAPVLSKGLWRHPVKTDRISDTPLRLVALGTARGQIAQRRGGNR